MPLDLSSWRSTFAAASTGLSATSLSHTYRHAAVLLALLVLAGCDSFGESERFVNEGARPPAVAALDVADLRPGQHVAGDVRLALDLDSLRGRVERVVLAIDGEDVDAVQRAPWELTLRTEYYSEGAHEVSVSVHLRGQGLGLLGLVGAPAVHLSTALVFDQREPTAVALTSTGTEGGRPRLTWAPSTDPNFFAYLVVRHSAWTDATPSYPWLPVVDTLYDRSATTYLDAPLPERYGARADYEVRVWNRRHVSPSAGTRAVTFGTSRPNLYAVGIGGVFSSDGAEVYVPTATGLAAFSTADHRELRRLSYDGLGLPGLTAAGLSLDPTGTEIFISYTVDGYLHRIHVVDAASFRVRRSFLLPEGAFTFAVGEGGIVFTVGEEWVYALDGQTGRVVAQARAPERYANHVVGVAPHGRSAYVLSYLHNSKAALHRYALVDGVLRSEAAFEWEARGLARVQVADDGWVVVHTHPGATVLDGRSLTPTVKFDLGLEDPWWAIGSNTFTVAAGRLYVSYPVTRPSGFGQTGVLAEVDLATGRRLRSWPFESPVPLVWTDGARWLYANTWEGGANTWIISL